MAAALASVATLAGCGGGQETHDAGTATKCLRAKGLSIARDSPNTFAPSSRDFVIMFPHGNVSLAFAPSQDAAAKVEDRVAAVAKANGATNTSDILRRNGNFVYWVNAQAFPAGLTKLVDRCL